MRETQQRSKGKEKRGGEVGRRQSEKERGGREK